jgi:hypothetical protein
MSAFTKSKSHPIESTETEITNAAEPAPANPPTAAPLVFLQPPSAGAKVPAPPSGAAPPGGEPYRSFVPKATELAALASAVTDLEKCTNFDQIFGLAGLPYAQVLQALDVGNQWSVMRQQTVAWDAFCRTQEGIAWTTVRTIINRLRPLFEFAAEGNPSLASALPGLATLFGAKRAIAKKGAATRRANRAAVARGEPPFHGGVGKVRMKRAQRAALVAAKATGVSTPPPTAGATPASTKAKANDTTAS